MRCIMKHERNSNCNVGPNWSYPQDKLDEAYAKCAYITEHYAKTFFLGTQLMTPEKSRAVCAIYVWCRRTDELVDGPNADRITPEVCSNNFSYTLLVRSKASAPAETVTCSAVLFETMYSSAAATQVTYFVLTRSSPAYFAHNCFTIYSVSSCCCLCFWRDHAHRNMQALDRWEERLEHLFEGRPCDNLDAALTDTVNRFPVDIQPFRDMIDGMRSDIVKTRYRTYDELYEYCYRVAGTVALMTMPVMGMDPSYKVRARRLLPLVAQFPCRRMLFSSCSSSDDTPAANTLQGKLEPVYRAALSLGIANQLTNILRDVGEDMRERNRIYVPLDELAKFDITEEELMSGMHCSTTGKMDDRYVRFTEYMVRPWLTVSSATPVRCRCRNLCTLQCSMPCKSCPILVLIIPPRAGSSAWLQVEKQNVLCRFKRRWTTTTCLKMASVPWTVLPGGQFGQLSSCTGRFWTLSRRTSMTT